MILYHGSYTTISHPDLLHTRKNVDFGPGFYTTPIYDQAVTWCARFKRRGQAAVISYYELDEAVYDKLRILRFDSYSEEWLNFIVTCRSGRDLSDYDIVIGGVANDKVFNTVELYCDGMIEKKEAIRRLKFEKPNLQIVFRTDEAVRNLRFLKGEEI